MRHNCFGTVHALVLDIVRVIAHPVDPLFKLDYSIHSKEGV